MPINLLVHIKGGAGSGNYGHTGRPGIVGGSGGSSGVGAGGMGSAKPSKHNVKLPGNPKKMTIQLAAEALDQMGMKFLGKGQWDSKTQTTTYEIQDVDGNVSRIDAVELRDIVYAHKD